MRQIPHGLEVYFRKTLEACDEYDVQREQIEDGH
jgi:hypothetical protein